MSKTEIILRLDSELLCRMDQLVERQLFGSRSEVIQSALAEMLVRRSPVRVVTESRKLDRIEEQRMADEDVGWKSS